MKENETALLLGDFNIPSFKTQITRPLFQQDTETNICNKAETRQEFMGTIDLISHNRIPNIQGNALDLLISNIPNIRVERTASPVPNEDSYHPPLQVIVSRQKHNKYKDPSQPENGTCKLCYRKANFVKMYELVRNKSWNELYNMKHPNKAPEYFQSFIDEVIKKNSSKL